MDAPLPETMEEERLRAALHDRPGDPWLLRDLAQELGRQRRLPEALAAAEAACMARPGAPGLMRVRAWLLLQANDPAAALPLNRQAAALQPDVADAHQELAAALGTLGRVEEALAAATVALDLAPGDAWRRQACAALRDRVRAGQIEAAAQIVYSSSTLRIVHVPVAGSAEVVVTFAHMWPVQGVHLDGFGRDFLFRQGLSAVHVTCAENDWYQYPEAPGAMAGLRGLLGRYGRVVTYGTSMGAHAAIRFSGALGAHAVIAAAPQVTIDPDRPPFDKRWVKEAARVQFIDDDICADTSGEVFLLFDPRTEDATHAAAIAARVPVRPIPLPHSGHSPLMALQELKLLRGLVLDGVAGRLQPERILAEYRARRGDCPTYRDELSARGRDAGRRIRLLHWAIAGRAGQPNAGQKLLPLWLALGRVLEAAGRMEEADHAFRTLAELPAKEPWYARQLDAFRTRRAGNQA